jgi:hypothetical protein
MSQARGHSAGFQHYAIATVLRAVVFDTAILFEDIVEEEIRSTVVAAVRALIV